MSHVHNQHGALSAEEKAELEEQAMSQEAFILKMMRGNPRKRFAYFDIKAHTGWDKDSVKRSLSNLSGSGNKKYKDEAGRWPLEYSNSPEDRKKNPKTGKTCGTYGLNPDYGNPSEQNNLFGAPKHQGPYSGVGA